MENSANNPRVFVDANILLSGNAFPRWPYEVLQHALNGEIHLVLSHEICSKLGEIGFDKDEINTIQIVHELKKQEIFN